MTATTAVPADTQARTYRFDLTPESDGLTLEGYAAVFDQPTRITERNGDFIETVRYGAFTHAVRANPRPVLQFDHGQHPLLGSIPIGAVQNLREDKKGLYVSARIHDNWLTEPVRDAIRSGAITGMSFRFAPAEGGETWNATRTERDLTNLHLFELGPVVWPAYTGTDVSIRAAQLVDNLTDDSLQDLAVALLLKNSPNADPSRLEDRAADLVPPSVVVEDDVRDNDIADPTVEVVSAPNPARYRATSFQVRADQVKARSITLEPEGLPD